MILFDGGQCCNVMKFSIPKRIRGLTLAQAIFQDLDTLALCSFVDTIIYWKWIIGIAIIIVIGDRFLGKQPVPSYLKLHLRVNDDMGKKGWNFTTATLEGGVLGGKRMRQKFSPPPQPRPKGSLAQRLWTKKKLVKRKALAEFGPTGHSGNHIQSALPIPLAHSVPQLYDIQRKNNPIRRIF